MSSVFDCSLDCICVTVKVKRKNRGLTPNGDIEIEELDSPDGRVLPLCMIKMKEEADQANTSPYGG